VYLSPVDDPDEEGEGRYGGFSNGDEPRERMFEISCRRTLDSGAAAAEKKFSWGVPVGKERVESYFTVSCDRVSSLFIREREMLTCSTLIGVRSPPPASPVRRPRRRLEGIRRLRRAQTRHPYRMGLCRPARRRKPSAHRRVWVWSGVCARGRLDSGEGGRVYPRAA
jgi:hypothetical protein